MTERPFPWSREIWSLLLDRLVGEGGAQVVIFDLIFNPPNDGDAAFHSALEKYRDHVVIGANFDRASSKIVGPNATLIPPPPEQDDRVGLVNFFPDQMDQKVRAAQYLGSDRILVGLPPFPGEPVYQSLSARAMTKVGHAADVPKDFTPRTFRYCAAGSYQPLKLWEIFDDRSWKANYGSGAFFKNKIIVVGDSSPVVHDVVNTPIETAMYGPVLHLHAMAAAIGHEFLSPTNPTLGYALVGAAGLMAWLLIALLRRPTFSLAAVIGLTVLYVFVALELYNQRGFFLLVVPVLSAFLLSSIFSLGFDYILERLEKVRTRRTLERYVSKNLVKEILENPGGYLNSLKGARMPATMLFSDLIGFTTLSEKADPEALVTQLNEYLSAMTHVVFENGGTLDKFIGDAIMVVWGNVQSRGVAEDAKLAARTALAMRRELKRLNEGWRTEGRMMLGMGIGVNHGEVLAGNIGSQERADLTVIGDAVNLASRLEALTRTYAVDILVGASAIELIKDEFRLRSVARVQVKGKTEPVEVATIIGAKTDKIELERARLLDIYEDAFRKFRERDFTGAKNLFMQFQEAYPDDYLAHMYHDHAAAYELNPPDEAWNAVEVFKKK